jgi:CDP-diacylglycerol--serine O-phosphatidyltransferase
MVSTVRYPSGKQVDLQTRTRFRTFLAVILVIGLMIFFREIAFMSLCLGYIFFGIIRSIRSWRRYRLARASR